jgi:GT2 family glycosyltransferase
LTRNSVSVVVCAYTDRRWSVLRQAIASIRAQASTPVETILVIDHNPRLLALAQGEFTDVRVVPNGQERGLSGARNTGLACAAGDVVAFLDDDACARPDWMALMAAPFGDASVIGVAGRVEPDWEAARPAWFPEEFLWVVGCSYRGLPLTSAPVRNPIGASMAFRRDVLQRVGGFATGVGRVDAVPLGCEETELSIRARRETAGEIVYVPQCKVDHFVPSERASLEYFLSRCWSEGLSKALVGASVGADAALSAERSYVARTLSAAISREIGQALRGDVAALRRAAAVVLGTVATAAGYVAGRYAKPLGRYTH